jgi:cysteinyl-tRNA synthetase
MNLAELGEQIDIHGGGNDLIFPHHENEIAQSECCNGTTFARHWYHSEHLLVDGTTMSKSKGNYYTLGDLIEKGIPPLSVRLALMSGHPRKQLNFTLATVQGEQSAINSILKSVRYFCEAAGRSLDDLYSPECLKQESWYPFERTWASLCDDLNFPEAFGRFFLTLAVSDSNKGMKTSQSKIEFNSLGKVLFALGMDLRPFTVVAEVPSEVKSLAEKRWAAKAAKDFATADALRKEIAAAGWSMLDGKEGYKLEPLKKP